MHLQKAVEPYDVFARALTIGPETMVMNFRPDEPMHNRYAVDHGFLSPDGRRRGGHDRADGQRVLPLGVQLLRDARPGRRRCCRSTTRTPARTSRSPRCTTTSRGRCRRCVKWSAFCVATGRRPRLARRPDRLVRGRRRPRPAPTPTSSARTSGSPTRTSSASATTSSARRRCPTSTRWSLDWVGSHGVRRAADADRRRDLSGARAVEQFLGHFRGLLDLWIATDQAARPTVSDCDYRPLGPSGLMVSSGRHRLQRLRRAHRRGTRTGAWSTPRSTPGSPCSTPPTSTARGASEELLGRALGSRRDDVVVATKFGMDMQRRERAGLGRPRLAPLHPHGGRGEPAAARHRLDRPLPAARARPESRRSTRRWPRCTSWWPRARSATSARRTSPAGRSSTPTGRRTATGQTAFVSAQNKYSLYDRSADDELIPACEHVGVEPAAVLPAGVRAAHRQVPARRGRAGGHPARRPARRSRLEDADFDRIEALDGVRRRAGRLDPRRRDRRPRSPSRSSAR